ILDSRFSVHNCGELDLVALDGACLVFVEVKARASDAFGGARSAVTASKQRKLACAALHYIKEKKPRHDSARFDIVAIGPGGLEHIENAFSPSSQFTY
ncbi:MAG: YraN family protein, partial [Elusimicrobia bacterium]|nr:YraN family protein [Elusimicrobiota bacterium]